MFWAPYKNFGTARYPKFLLPLRGTGFANKNVLAHSQFLAPYKQVKDAGMLAKHPFDRTDAVRSAYGRAYTWKMPRVPSIELIFYVTERRELPRQEGAKIKDEAIPKICRCGRIADGRKSKIW